jgi:hypothetical protein
MPNIFKYLPTIFQMVRVLNSSIVPVSKFDVQSSAAGYFSCYKILYHEHGQGVAMDKGKGMDMGKGWPWTSLSIIRDCHALFLYVIWAATSGAATSETAT